jgi:hypothetical protein
MIVESSVPAFQKEPITRALVIGVDVEGKHDPHPYDVLACVFREAVADYLGD